MEFLNRPQGILRTALGLIVLSLFLLFFTATPGVVRGEADASFDEAINVQINPAGAIIGWVSADEEDGFVNWGTAAGVLTNTEPDVRDASIAYADRTNKRTHQVAITTATLGAELHYEIVSGGVTTGPFSVQLPTDSLTGVPDFITGSVSYDNDDPGRECLVSVRVNPNLGAVLHSLWISGMTDGGGYSLDITNVRQDPSNAFLNNFNSAMPYNNNSAADTISVIARCDPDAVGQIDVPTEGRYDAGFANMDVVVVGNAAPVVVNAIPDQTATEDDPDLVLDLSNVFDDPAEGDPFTLSPEANDNPTLVTANLVGTNLTLDFQDHQNGVANITIRATDDVGGGTVDDTFEVTVNAVNDNPTLEVPIADQTATEDDPDLVLDLSATFGDVDIATNADSLTLTVENNSNASLVTASVTGPAEVTLDFQDEQNGTADITVRATDTGNPGLFAEDTFTVDVAAVNDQPTVANAIADQTPDEDDPDLVLDLSNVFDDMDIATNGDSLTLSKTNTTNPTLVTANLVGTNLTLDFQDDQNGTADITVRATDTGTPGLFAEDTFTVDVAAVNDAPVANIDLYNVEPATPIAIDAIDGVLKNDTDVDDGDSLTAALVDDVPLGKGALTFSADGSFTYDPEAFIGTTSFTYEAVDDSGAANDTSAPATVTLSQGPLFKMTVEPTIGEGLGPLQVTIDLINADPGTPSSVQFSSIEDDVGPIPATSDDFALVTRTVTLGGGSAEQEIINVPINSDNADELDETFKLTLSGEVNANIAGDSLERVDRIALDGNVLGLLGVIPQLFQLAQRLYAQHAVLGQADLAGQRFDARL